MSLKVDTSGNYTPFYGYTVVAMCADSLSWIENFLRNSRLSEYYSPLPALSYHMTVFNVWCHGQAFLPSQKRWLDETYMNYAATDPELAKMWKQQVIDLFKKHSSCWWPNEAMLGPMLKANEVCATMPDSYMVQGDLQAAGTLQIGLHTVTDESSLHSARNLLSSVFEHYSPLRWHITLAYQYKPIPPEDQAMVQEQLQRLQMLMSQMEPIRLRRPDARWFDSMERFMSIEEIVEE